MNVVLDELSIDSYCEVALYKTYVRDLYKSIQKDAEALGVMDFDATYTDDDFWTRVRDKSRKFYWLSTGETIVGIITIRNLKDSVKISNLYIVPEHRHRGYGRQAISLIKTYYGKPITLQVYYEGQAKRLYESMGFKPVYTEMLLK